MSGDDRIELLKSGLCNLVDEMRPTDRVAIITYSGSVKRVLESTLAKDASKTEQRAYWEMLEAVNTAQTKAEIEPGNLN